MENNTNNNMSENVLIKAFKDILALKFEPNQTIADALNSFYDVMRRYGIKQSTPQYNDEGEIVSRTLCNPEWSICYNAFQKQFEFFLTMQNLTNVPKDVQ